METKRSSDFEPVGLKLHGSQTRTIVRNLTDAARVLLQDWPNDDGEEFVMAVKACVDAITGEINTERFRQALLRAAREAGIATFSIVPEAALPGVGLNADLSLREQ